MRFEHLGESKKSFPAKHPMTTGSELYRTQLSVAEHMEKCVRVGEEDEVVTVAFLLASYVSS